MSFGAPPESNVLSFPGISGNRFDPVSAGKCWAAVIKSEQDKGFIHRTLDGHGKLGLPPAWSHYDYKNALMPGFESQADAYYMTGWKKNKFGATEQPDISHLIPALRKEKARQKEAKKLKKKRVYEELLGDPFGTSYGTCSAELLSEARPQSSAPSEARSARRGLVSSASAPRLVPERAPPPPGAPPPGNRSRSVAALSQTAPPGGFGLSKLRAKGEFNSSSSSVRESRRREKVAALVSAEVSSLCSHLLDGTQLRRY